MNKSDSLPASLSGASNDEILQFFRDSQAVGSSLNRCRVMLVGECNVGKTYLRHRLVRPTCNLPPWDGGDEPASTDGIDVGYFGVSVPKIGSSAAASSVAIRCSVWDFAGQTSYRASHTSFLASECLYLVCFHTRDLDINASCESFLRATKLDYWLHSIQSHAPGARVILVGTQAPKVCTLPVAAYRALPKMFPGLIFSDAMVAVCAKDKADDRVERGLKSTIQRVLTQMPHVQVSCPQGFLKLAVMLEAAQSTRPSSSIHSPSLAQGSTAPHSSVVTMARFDAMLNEAGLSAADHRRLCLTVFRAVGLLLYFETGSLRDVVFLDPILVADQLALLFTAHNAKQQRTEGGIVSINTLHELWCYRSEARGQAPSSSANPPLSVQALVSLIEQFRVGVRIDSRSFLFPSKLPSLLENAFEPTPMMGLNETCLQLQFSTSNSKDRKLPPHFLEWEGFLPRLQVALHQLGRALYDIRCANSTSSFICTHVRSLCR